MTKKNILLIGDSILDIYVKGTAIGKSAETPTIVARELGTEHSLGGAFLVVRNLLELGAGVTFATLVGGDAEADLVSQFQHENLKSILLRDPSRRTTVKKRFWVDGYKLLQFDNLDNRPLQDGLQIELFSKLQAEIPNADLVIISDYRHGLLLKSLIAKILHACKKSNKAVYIDSQVSQNLANHVDYAGADLFCLNEKEARCLVADFDASRAEDGLAKLSKILNSPQIVVKLGDKGCVAKLNDRVIFADAMKLSPVDTCGAGDAFLAALSMGNLAQPENALKLANRWAGLSTLIHGAQPPKMTEFANLEALPC